MRRILVTGATGFIGGYLVDRLIAKKLSVKILVRNESPVRKWEGNVDVVKGDIRDDASVRRATVGVDTVFHLAGKVHDLEEINGAGDHTDVTVNGTRTLLSAAEENDIRSIVFLSSLSVYGKSSAAVQDEASPCAPNSDYGLAKMKAEEYVIDHGIKLGTHVCCLRPAMVYGLGCKGNLPRMIRMIDRGLFPPLLDIHNHRSMIHVSNVVDAVVLAATHPAANGQCYVVTDGRPYSTTELYEMICRSLGRSIPRWRVPIALLKGLAGVGDVVGRLRGRRFFFDSGVFEKLTGNAWYSSEKIVRELGYRPSVTLEDALPEMISWYRGTRLQATC